MCLLKSSQLALFLPELLGIVGHIYLFCQYELFRFSLIFKLLNLLLQLLDLVVFLAFGLSELFLQVFNAVL